MSKPYCVICKTFKKSGETSMLVLGDQWVEYCEDCKNKKVLENKETGEDMSIAEVIETQKKNNNKEQ